MDRREQLLEHFRDLVLRFPPPSLQDLFKLMQDDHSFRTERVRYVEVKDGKNVGYYSPVNDNVSWQFINVEKYFSNISKICDELKRKHNLYIYCTSFYTPPNSKAFTCHFDPNEVLVVQAFGSKYWQIWPQLPESVYDHDLNPPQDPILEDFLGQHESIEVVLREDDCFYLEARKPHVVCTKEQDSLSHTFIFHDMGSKFVEYCEKKIKKQY